LFGHDLPETGFHLFGIMPCVTRDLPYRAGKCLQIRQPPLRGIKSVAPTLMLAPQAALRTSVLVMAAAFPHHAAQQETLEPAQPPRQMCAE
jgi:hypothetical protein